MINRSYANQFNRYLFIFVIWLIAFTSAYAQTDGIKEFKLDNGMVVLMKEVHSAPVFTAQVWFKVGSRNEHSGITGISHILEHMLFNTSKHYKKGEISQMVRERGGIENAATWTDFTYYWQLMGSDNLEFSLKTLAERVGNAKLLPDELANERTVVLSEMAGNENNPNWLLYRDVYAAAFMAHPYQWPTIGWKSDVENISDAQLKDYYNKYYYPNNATLVLVGDFDTQNALALVKKHFGGTPAHPLPRPVYTTEPPQRGERSVIVKREGNAERVVLGYHIPELTHPDTYALTVLDQILSGGKSSRLYQALVETQLATSAWSSAGSRRDPSLFMLGATARQGVQAAEIEKSLLEQVNKAKTTLPTDAEMQAAKNQLEAYLIFQNDSVSDQGEQLGYYNTVSDWKYLQTLIPKIKAVTPQEVQAVAVKYLTTDNLTSGKFIPAAPAQGGGADEQAGGPIQKSLLPDISKGVAYYKKPAKKPAGGVVSSAKKESKLIKPTRVVLDNGMVVIVQENHSNPTIAIDGNIKAGSYFDPTDKKGTASLTAEMIARGTQKRTALELARATESVGAEIDTSAGVESAEFTAKSLSRNFELVLDILSDQLRNASFPQDQFDRAKGEMLSRLEQSKESTRSQAVRAFYNNVFPEGHPYHELTVEQAEQQLQTITRDDTANFYKSYYRPDTAIIVIAGDVKAADAVNMVKKYFGDWQAQGTKPEINIPTVEAQSSPKQTVIQMMDKSEVSVMFGNATGLSRINPEFYAARIMNQILGGGGALGSILGTEIREKRGLVYNVYSTFDATLGAGPWYASLGTNPKDVDQAVTTLKEQIAKFKENGPTQKQFQQAKQFIIGVFPIALESNSGVARALLSAEFYGLGMDYLQNYSKYYNAVTLQQVNAAAKKYLHPETATLVIAGPYNKP